MGAEEAEKARWKDGGNEKEGRWGIKEERERERDERKRASEAAARETE